MDDNQIQTLFQHVLLDQEFSNALARDPISALATLGVEAGPKDVPRAGVKLPSRTAIFRAWENAAGDCTMARGTIRAFIPAGGKDGK